MTRAGIPQSWKVLAPIGLVLLVIAHAIALIFRIQPAVSLWFPPSGVAIALTLWLGPLGVVLTGIASMLMAPFWGNDGWFRLAAWTDATEPLVAWWMYRHYWQGSLSLQRFRDAASLILSAPIFACATSAIVGSLTLALVGKMPGEHLTASIPHWWLGNAIGVMTVAPPALLLLTPTLQKRGWVSSQPEINPHPHTLPQFQHLKCLWVEILAIGIFSIAIAIVSVIRTKATGFDFQQYSFLNFIVVIWAATRFGVIGGTLTASFCVLSTLLAYVLSYPNAIALSSFPVNAEVLSVHKLSLLVQCVVSLLLGTAYAEKNSSEVALAVERIRVSEYQERAQLSEQLASAIARLRQLNREKDELFRREQVARNEAESANRMKDEFLAVLSHELRSPLNPILGWLHLLKTRKHDEKTTTRALEIIERNAKLQAQLVEDLLDVSRILRDKLSLNATTVNLAIAIATVIESVHLLAEAKSIELQFDILDKELDGSCEYLVLGDVNRLQQVIGNLLTNAIKFTPEGGRVEVLLQRVEERKKDKGDKEAGEQGEQLLTTNYQLPISKSAQIQVIDTGKGISPNFLPHIFDRFRQADSSTTRKFGGLGLGLAIVRHLVEMHGGAVTAESPGEGQGATFTVKLPLVHPPDLDGKNNTASTDGIGNQDGIESITKHLQLENVRILLVDDEADTRQLIAFSLQQHGAIVTALDSATKALEILPQIKPDLLISDIGMPQMDGYALIRQIGLLSRDRGGQVPAIALTAYAGETDRQKALAAGFQKHITKPVDLDRLLEAVVGVVAQSAAARTLQQ